MSKETELSDKAIKDMHQYHYGVERYLKFARAVIAADRELRRGDVTMPVIAYAYDDPEYGFAGSPCKRFSGTPPGRAQNSEALVRLSDAQAALAALNAELANALKLWTVAHAERSEAITRGEELEIERDALRKDAGRLDWLDAQGWDAGYKNMHDDRPNGKKWSIEGPHQNLRGAIDEAIAQAVKP